MEIWPKMEILVKIELSVKKMEIWSKRCEGILKLFLDRIDFRT